MVLAFVTCDLAKEIELPKEPASAGVIWSVCEQSSASERSSSSREVSSKRGLSSEFTLCLSVPLSSSFP